MSSLRLTYLPPPVLLALAIFFVWLTAARLTYQQGLTFSEQNNWPAARTVLTRAAADYGILDKGEITAAPWYVPSTDSRRLYIAIGENYLAEAVAVSEMAKVFPALQKAESSFRAALHLQPLDVEAQTGLARAMAALEGLFARSKPGQGNPYQAAPELEKLLRLRPNGIEAHMLFIRYLNGIDQNDKRLAEVASHLAAIHPQAVDVLKHDLGARRDWRDRLEPALTEGLGAAIAENNNPVAAYRALSQLAEERGDMAAAVDELSRALVLAGSREQPALSWDYSRLADLYLRRNSVAATQNTEQAANQAALQALRLSANRDRTLRDLWRIYKGNRRFQPFLDLLAQAEKSIRLPDSFRIVQAACLIESDNTRAAQSSLLSVKDPSYQAEALRSLAELAQRDKNWDAMELAAQRATVIEPKNSDNYYLFAKALGSQKKYRQAAEAMDSAIAAAIKEDPWLYDFRAWIYWGDNKFEAARADWLKAIQLLPDNAYFYQSLGMAYEKEGDKLQAVTAMKKAVALAPGNADFVKQLQELEK